MKYEKICRHTFVLSLVCAIIGLIFPALFNKMQFFPENFLIPLCLAAVLGAVFTFIMDGRVEILPGFWIKSAKN